ncbi:MAG TPA: prepilin-type N-terminal cleavage/methylation domain-containing protein [Bacillota bacterium]|nr:prepilin-type N-terminal cleavage/methylation domain-containing protein [Bacillota bacterium]
MIWEKNESAYTLAELLCVLAILALLMAIAAPSFAGWSEMRQLQLAARTVALDMRRVQQAAITSGYTSCLQFYLRDPNKNDSYRIVDSAANTVKRVYLPDGISVSHITFIESGGTYNLCFLRSGAPNRGGTVCLRNERGERLYVIVTPATGRVRISNEPPDHWEVP